MKHTQLILAAALVALAGCSKENIDLTGQNSLDNEIGFTAVTRKATKANDAIQEGGALNHDNTFQVWGWQSQAGDFSEFADDAASNFMSNLTISWCKGPQNRDEAWRNSAHYYYWPYTGKISFLAVHPSTVAPSTTGWDATNDKPQATFADYTIAAGNKTVDLMLATNEGSRRADALPMVFSHALSQIQFRARTNEDYHNDVTFTLNSVTLNNIDLSGDLAYGWVSTPAQGETPAFEGFKFNWTDNAAQTQSWPYYATSKEVAYAASDSEAAFYGDANVMIPQAANADDPATTNAIEGTTITINYTMEQTGSAAITGTVTVAAPWTKVKEGDTTYNEAQAVAAWEPGKKYVYTLNFKLNEINFAPEVTDWIEVDMSTISILD